MPRKVALVALLLFGSGFCALVYQVTWLRLLRLVFGASTPASAAVLAIFMGWLGLGGWLLGARVDRKPRPLAFYAVLELGITVAAALSPLLVAGVHAAYVGLGGTARLGLAGGTVLRLLLAAVVLGPATYWMGGTLPAAARAVERSSDGSRRLVALLYGANTLGAVTGALWTTFLSLELLGVRGSIWAATALNLGIALAASALARRWRQAREEPAPRTAGGEPERARAAPVAFVLPAAAAVGFAFFAMELVWYRMLAPLLGGSTYTFGLILAVALLGVGVGGLLYAAAARRWRPTLAGFAVTSAAEALCLALPYALGDRLAVVAMLLRPVGQVRFLLLVGAWSLLAAVVVLPAAIVAGYQFPLLVALLGKGRRRVGREVGLAYAWNTAGALAGALAGGFGLLPWLSAPGCWIAVTVALAALAAVALVLAARRGARLRRAVAPAALAAAALLLVAVARGPTAVWRHTPTGAGGMPARFEGPNDLRQMMRTVRRSIVWEVDGRESSVAIHALDDYTFLLNGKAEGSALGDAPTQVMSGLIGAVLHPGPRRALVIGLGTGSSAGWLAEVESMERVDVVELEPAIEHVARLCAPVNHRALEHPKVRLTIGDGRELLLTSRERYDLIYSEPSDPYRAGVASLFSRELYAAAAERLGPRGLFLQWLQGYHVDSQVVRTVLATLGSVFPHVETWQVHRNDLLLVAGRTPWEHDLERVRERVAREPLRSALRWVMGVEGAEGFYAGFVAGRGLAAAVRQAEGERLNTDDHPILELGFARALGRDLEFSAERLLTLAQARGESRPELSRGRLDLRRWIEMRSARNAKWGVETAFPASGDPALDARVAARNAYARGDLASARRHWLRQAQPPSCPLDHLLAAEALADRGDRRALELAAALAAAEQPVGAALVRARFHFRSGREEEAAAALAAAFRTARRHPWAHRPALARGLALARELSRRRSALGRALFGALAEPFAVHLLDDPRLRTRLALARGGDFEELCVEALEPFEPHVPWEREFLELRRRCYAARRHPAASRAEEELAAYLSRAPADLSPEPRATAL